MKNILITGVSTGIGYDACRLLIKEGYHVFGSVRKQSDVDRLLLDFPDRFTPLLFDVKDDQSITKEAARVKDLVGSNGITCLINNAGIAVPGPLNEMPLSKFQEQIDINVYGVMRVTNAFLPLLGTDTSFIKKPGKIINISSVSGLFNSPFNGAYCISKHALESMTDVYRRELMKYNIDVIAIEPGPIKTPIWDKALAVDWVGEYKDSDYQDILVKAKKMIESSEKSALPVEKVSQLIKKIIEKNNPRTRYIVHKNAFLFKIMSKYIPDRLVDRIIRKNLFSGKKIRPF